LTLDPEAITATVRQKLAAGVLPAEECVRTWFGPGLGSRCDACERPIRKDQFECECDMANGTSIRFHRECFRIWDVERQAFQRG
jgi:hypothetical protein